MEAEGLDEEESFLSWPASAVGACVAESTVDAYVARAHPLLSDVIGLCGVALVTAADVGWEPWWE